MNIEIFTFSLITNALLIGIGATIVMDIWGAFLKHALGIVGLNYAFVGRWFGHMLKGKFKHNRISEAPPVKRELFIGWSIHYLTGVIFTFVFLLIVKSTWLVSPTIFPAVLFGIITVVFPYFIMQPCLGLGIAASKTPSPHIARIKSAITHLVFGFGLYVSAKLTTPLL